MSAGLPGQHVTKTALLGLALALVAPSPTSAQVYASERATVAQTVDGTTITIEYSRPSLRGRSAREDIFGDQVAWGTVWTPGANDATTLETNKDIRLSGVAVPAGRWSVWMVVGEEEWELVLDPRDDLYHIEHPEPTDEQIRLPIQPYRTLGSAETLAWSFPSVRRDQSDLRMQWGDVAVDLLVEVEPTVSVTFSPEEAAAYIGLYSAEQIATEYAPSHSYELELRYVDEILVGTIEFSADFATDVAFVKAADQVFKLGRMMSGAVVGVEGWSFVEFVMNAEGRAESFELRDADDDLIARGTRLR